jgi:hypothetical protein
MITASGVVDMLILLALTAAILTERGPIRLTMLGVWMLGAARLFASHWLAWLGVGTVAAGLVLLALRSWRTAMSGRH